MTRFFNKFSRLAAVAVLAGVVVPQVASADHKPGGNRNFSKVMQSGGNSQFRVQNSVQPMAIKKFSSNTGNFQQLSGNSLQSSPKFKVQKLNTGINSQVLSNQKFKTLPGTVLNPRKVTTTPITGNFGNVFPDKITTKPGKFPGKGPIFDATDPVINPFPGGKPPKINPLPGGPLVDTDPVINPFPGGKPPKVDPFPGGEPPVADPGQGGGGNGGNGNGNGNGCGPGNGGKNCHNKCPWPVFWPIYQGGYWNNSCYYGSGYNTPVIVNSAPVVVPASATVDYGTARVDLVLEDVQYVEPATMLVGPAYRVKFRNQGLSPVGKFRVALVASIDGQASEQSPKALVDVAGLASGESSEVTVRLPVTAMKLAAADGKATIFTHLLVAADFDNSVVESDKTNNVAIIERTMLEVAAK